MPLSEIAARFGTPCYVYSRAALETAWREFDAAFAGVPHLVCYAMKANPNLAVLDLFARLGSGFDIVSGGELERVLAAGGDPSKVVFSGVGKSEAEMAAALRPAFSASTWSRPPSSPASMPSRAARAGWPLSASA